MNLTDQHRRILTITLAVGLVIGLMLGLVYAYLINPVEWVDAPMNLTRSDIQEDYLRMAIDSYKLYYNPMDAYRRWLELGDAGPVAMERVINSPGEQGLASVEDYRKLVDPYATVITPVCPQAAPAINNLYLYLWLGTVVFGGGIGVYYYSKLRQKIDPSSPRSFEYSMTKIKEDKPITIPFNQYPVLVHTMMTYVQGDDLWDESQRVEDHLGDYLGECGIGIVHTVDEELPKKVSGMDIWLFDKNEIDTKTVVLLSEDAYLDEVIFQELRSKGEPILCEIGREIILQTSNLVMIVRVVDMVCEEVRQQKCNFFQRLTMEIFVRKLT